METYIIADRQELTAYALRHLIDNSDSTRILTAHDKATLTQMLLENEQCVVVLDYALFDFPDEAKFIVLSQRFPHSSWLLISEDLTEHFLKQVVYNTTNVSVIFKDSPLTEISNAINYAKAHKRFISQRVTEILLLQRQREFDPSSRLTPTEIEIIHSIAQGKTTKEIATERYSSIHTINSHRKNIFRKFNVNTAHEAVRAAVRSGLIDIAEYYI